MVDDDWLRRAESAIKQLYENPIILTLPAEITT